MTFLLLIFALYGESDFFEVYELEDYTGTFCTDSAQKGHRTALGVLQFDKENPVNFGVDIALYDHKMQTFKVLDDDRAKRVDQVLWLNDQIVFYQGNNQWATILDRDLNFIRNTTIHEVLNLDPKKGRVIDVSAYTKGRYVVTLETKKAHKLAFFDSETGLTEVVKTVKSKDGFGHLKWVPSGEDLYLVERDIAKVSLLDGDFKSKQVVAPERLPTRNPNAGMMMSKTGRKDYYRTILNLVEGHPHFIEARWLRYYDENGENNPVKQEVIQVNRDGFKRLKVNKRFIATYEGKGLYFYNEDQEFRIEAYPQD